MTKPKTTAQKLDSGVSAGLLAGVLAVVLVFLLGGLIAYRNTGILLRDATLVTHTHEVLSALSDVLSLMKDAETGQRGFIITGDERYLQPYTFATKQVSKRLQEIEKLVADNPLQLSQLPALQSAVEAKMSELADTIKLRRNEGFEPAQALVNADRGREVMDRIRTKIDDMQRLERQLRLDRLDEMQRAYSVAIITGIITTLVGVALAGVVGYLLRQAMLRRAREEWLQVGQIELGKSLGGDQSYEQLAQNILRFFAEYLGSNVAAFFVRDSESFRRIGTYGVPVRDAVPEDFNLNDGLLGQAARDKRAFFISDVPEGYLKFGSALGDSKPRHIAIVPIIHEGLATAVMEFGFSEDPDSVARTLFDRIGELIGPAVKSVGYRMGLQSLLEETQRQGEELQSQSEELRVSNEELEEQGRALRESQQRLETQQAELEQTNANLEEQTQLLEMERDQVTRAKTALELQAAELEKASRYKSDFLANMSHELRTPLNSSLILAKLLADNPAGNLTPEQVEYAETIRTSGNDLLTLINDILDLSKIEAGHMEVHADKFSLSNLLEDLKRTFQPLAQQKHVGLEAQIEGDCPEQIYTDRQRLEQILKNLLSNAVKFTEKGSVSLSVKAATDDRVAFSVGDTGIGIANEQQEIVFEAFRQADGTTNRKYGGTGLGLSISRELARLLGGDIGLESQIGKGSTFTLIIPASFEGSSIGSKRRDAMSVNVAQEQSLAAPPLRSVRTKSENRSASRMEDDRDSLASDGRAILVIEDDDSFAKILIELAHECNFQCLVAQSAEEGFDTALQYLPNAVLLDIGLPDHSGLWVLDRLKHERRTRHIPVHVISGNDYAQTAYSLGAVGYMLKPVKREELTQALTQLENRIAQQIGRILIVEDDNIQRDSLQKLLQSQDVETKGVATAAECLESLREQTFDCMVLDLSLPDATGYSLLETLSREEAYAFPPVIVYTGRQLSPDEEQKLRRYSKSIIIKGAKSPERLLDEVTLFLHRVDSDLPPEQQRMLERARNRDAAIEGHRILVVEDDVRNIFALTSMLEPRGALVQIARNGREALACLEVARKDPAKSIDLVLMDVMMPEMDGISAVKEIRKVAEWKKLPVIMLTAKAMKDDQETCIAAGANDYMAKPLDVEKLLSLVRVWMPR
jgi:signal transduction histidine kinase/DNA-binding response OmpR family regulator/CHASE3 domain sensor protein